MNISIPDKLLGMDVAFSQLYIQFSLKHIYARKLPVSQQTLPMIILLRIFIISTAINSTAPGIVQYCIID